MLPWTLIDSMTLNFYLYENEKIYLGDSFVRSLSALKTLDSVTRKYYYLITNKLGLLESHFNTIYSDVCRISCFFHYNFRGTTLLYPNRPWLPIHFHLNLLVKLVGNLQYAPHINKAWDVRRNITKKVFLTWFHVVLWFQFSSVQSLSRVQLFVIPWTAACQASLSITKSQTLLKLMSIESVMPSNHLILWHPLLLLPSIFPSIRVFSKESVLCIIWPKYWSFNLSISTSTEYAGLISFRMDWLHLLTVQETLKSLIQHHISKALILWCSAFLILQLSDPYMTTGKTTALTKWTFVG